MATKILGKDFRITLDDTTQKVLVFAQECSYTSETTMLEANHKDNANWVEREPDVNDYSITGTGLVAWDPSATELSFQFLKEAKDAGTPVNWEFNATTGYKLSGSGYLSSLELSANDGEYVAHGWTILANGPDTFAVIP